VMNLATGEEGDCLGILYQLSTATYRGVRVAMLLEKLFTEALETHTMSTSVVTTGKMLFTCHAV
jgi:hypothetical protein